ncbi:uncharacterized protein LOC142542773 isoform X1 [Primulina tabacum]|uniref:uncharacterized protein LOC142542773 isoform X1 n=2 Tax=Primulina tabacum TaxID=48773 RepID=UPI003F5A4A33
MLEDQVANLLQRYLGNYVRGLSKEALKISVWQGDVELTNMQLKPEALNALKLPVKVKAGFLGSVKLKVPWSRLGQEPVLVHLDRIFLLAEPATHVEGSSEDAIQDAKKTRIREMESKLLETRQKLNTELNKSWLGSLINTVIGNLKLSISNIHVRYEDLESNPGHPFAAGVTLDKLSAITVDDNGKETFITGGALEQIKKSAELERLAIYWDSDINPWYLEKPWEDLLPVEWAQVFKLGTKDGKPATSDIPKHSYILQPVSGNASYLKDRPNMSGNSSQPLQRVTVNLDDVTLCLSKNGYGDLLKLADNFTAFNQRLKYAHYRPVLSVKADPKSWWKYVFKVVSDQEKKGSGKLSWEQVLRYASLRKKYVSLYAALLKSDLDRTVVDDNKDIEELDRELDLEVILQWRMLAHKFVEQSVGSELYKSKQKAKKSWWPFGWTNQPEKDENEPGVLTEEDWERLNNLIGFKEGDDKRSSIPESGDLPFILLKLHMRHNASKLIDFQECLADLSCDNLDCCVKLYSEAKVFDIKLGSYRLLSPNGLLAESESATDSLVGVFSYKPLDADVDWSMVAKASPCYVTYLKDSIDQIINFFQNNAAVSQTLARETVSAVQMTFDEVKRTAARQVNRALKERTRFFLDFDIAAPKITIPTEFYPDGVHRTKLLLDLGKLMIRSQDDAECASPDERNIYSQFNLVLRDVSAFLVDGDYHWSQAFSDRNGVVSNHNFISLLPVVDKCGVFLKLQQIRSPVASFPSTRLSVRLPSIGFHFSPARYHRLMRVAKIFQGEDANRSDVVRPWDQSDLEGWLYHLTWKGVGGREAVWQRRYFCVVGPFLYELDSPESRSYKNYFSLRGKQLLQIPAESVGEVEHVLAVCDAERSSSKVVEDANALILRCDSENSSRTWRGYIQGAIYRVSGTAPITRLMETSSDSDDSEHGNNNLADLSRVEKLFFTGVLDELKISFSYSSQSDQSFVKLLLSEERRLLEFRAIGGQIEVSMRENDVFIGMVLKALEIEDLVCSKGTSRTCYLARSFIRNEEAPFSLGNTEIATHSSNDVNKYDGDDEFFEASESLLDSVGSPLSPADGLEHMSSRITTPSPSSSLTTPSFVRVPGLLPGDTHLNAGQMGVTDALDSFVKSQMIIFDQNSTLYANVDKQVVVTLSTLSFFCRRPTILAIMEFVNAINTQDDSCESFSDSSSTAPAPRDTSISDSSSTAPAPRDTPEEAVDDSLPHSSVPREEPVIKSLLGKGKSRVIFDLALNMTRAEILLMKENGSKLATVSQNNFLTTIKVFPSSFSIKASLGNLRISDDSLHSSHMYFWACDMRNPGGSSFVELVFCSFSREDEDYEGYDYSLVGQLSEVRIVYLNRFVQEVISYFMGLVPSNPKDVIKVNDQAANSEKWLTKGEIEGSPAMKLDLSLNKPIILMPQRTNSKDYLKLDVVQIAVQNTFKWIGGGENEMKALHLEILKILFEDINLNVGSGSELGESIIQDVKGVSIVIQRTLRDLLHQIPSIEVSIKIEALKAALSNKEYEIIMECALENISETPNIEPPSKDEGLSRSVDAFEHSGTLDSSPAKSETENKEKTWVTTKISVDIDLVELSIHYGITRDAPLATLQISGVWLLYKSNTVGEGFFSATLKGLIVVDDREGTEQELRLAIGKPDMIGYNPSESPSGSLNNDTVEATPLLDSTRKFVPALLILDARFCEKTTYVVLCIQRPQLLVAIDFLLAIVEFFVPTVRGSLSNEEDPNSLQFVDALILDKPTFCQPRPEFSIAPHKPLIVDDERFDLFTYDGRGGILYLKDRQGLNLSGSSREALVYVGNGKKLQFTNVTIKSGKCLDSCIRLGSNSSYSASENDNVILEEENGSPSPGSSGKNATTAASQNTVSESSMELTFELQAIGPELTFYNTSRNAGSLSLSNKLLHAQLDAFSRVVLKGNTVQMSADVLGLTMESNGITILEPFNTSVKFSNASGKMSIQLAVSDVFMNFSFSILRLFLAVEEDILSFLRTRSKKPTVFCSEFDRIGIIKNSSGDQVYAFWRPREPTGFAILGDYLTPIDRPPTKGVFAVNTSLLRVKRPKSFTRLWPPSSSDDNHLAEGEDTIQLASGKGSSEGDTFCSIWLPEPPKGYVAMGCVASPGMAQPPISSVFCILASLVTPCGLRDCIIIGLGSRYPDLAFWRVDNAFGTFLPAGPSRLTLSNRAYELRHVYFGYGEISQESKVFENQASPSVGSDTIQSERSSTAHSRRRFEAVATFQLIWWNQGSGSRKNLSIWRPLVPEGMMYFGDIAVQGYEPPNTCVVLQDLEDYDVYKAPLDFQLVQHIKRHSRMDSISFWMPQAPPGYVSLGCIACKGIPKLSDFSSLRCIRSDMVSADQFLEESTWDTSDFKFTKEHFSIWTVGNELGTFIARNGLKKPPKRFAFKLVDPDVPSSSDETVIDAEIKTFSAALFDDYGGLMVPLCNISLSGMGLSLHGRQDSLNSSVVFSLAARSYNDKYESWEPLIEPVDGSLRYHYNPNAPGIASQLSITSSRDLNLNVSVSNTNMILQAYASWDNLSHAQEARGQQEANSPVGNNRHKTTAHKKTNYFIIPQNKLGKDIFIRAPDVGEFPGIIRMPAGDNKVVKVPVPKNMLDSHLKGRFLQQLQVMVTIIVAEAELPNAQCASSPQYSVAIRLYKDQSSSTHSYLNEQSARTRGTCSYGSESPYVDFVMWNEVFFFKINSAGRWMVEFIVTETGKGELIGHSLSSLKQFTGSQNNSDPHNHLDQFMWLELSPGESELDLRSGKLGRIKCAVFLPLRTESEITEKSVNEYRKSGSVQISPAREGPWTMVRLNYGAPAACWQLGSDVVASEVSVHDGNRYIAIRSLVSVQNTTDVTLDLCLKLKASNGNAKQIFDERNQAPSDDNEVTTTDEYFESEKFNPGIGWVPCNDDKEGVDGVQLASGWQWLDEWSVDKSAVNTSDGWVYAPDLENLGWPESYNPLKHANYARQRRWTRNRKRVFEDFKSEIVLGPLKPGEVLPLPVPCLASSALYVLQLRPSETTDKYLWSSAMDMSTQAEDMDRSKEVSEICVSNLVESESLLCCSEIGESSSHGLRGMWFSLSTKATEIMKDIHFNPIHDWAIVIKSPVSVANYLPFMTEISLLEMQTSGHFLSSFRGVFSAGETVKMYNSDIRNPLYFSLLPQAGWLPLQEAILISQSSCSPSKTMNFRSSVSGRIVQIIIEQNHSEERPLIPKIIKVYSPYWIRVARCPPLSFRLIDSSFKRSKKFQLSFQTKRTKEVILEEITDEEMYDGHTIASALNFKSLGLSASINHTGVERFGPVKDLSPLGDMDGSLDLLAYNADGNCMQLFVSAKPCPYQSVPTKVISVRPFMTFTNRVGQNMFLKFNSEDESKVLRASDTRVSFVHQEMDEPNEIQVRLDDTEWSFPLQIVKEDTVTLALKKHDGIRSFLRTEIRGYEEGSRFIVVFRLGSSKGPIRIENRTTNCTISFRQTGFGDDAWIQLKPLSTTAFSWEDPYGQKIIDAKVHSASDTAICKYDLNKLGLSCLDGNSGLYINVKNTSDVKVVSFLVESMLVTRSVDGGGSLRLGDGSQIHSKLQEERSALELIVELGVVGISVVDHKPREVAYLYMERVFISYSTGYDGGTTSRFKLMFGYMQLDNQLPLTAMPVLLAPEQTPDMHHPVFKMTLTMRNENLDGLQIYPYVYIRVTDKCWRVNIHEPIIWALIDFYSSLQLDSIPQNSSVSQVDPEIRIDLIDISEVRLKVSLETAPGQRPHGLLGVWSPLLSAVGNAFKIQVHLRKVMHRDRFLRKSSIISAVGNRIWRDLIHNPLHIIFSVDVLGVTSSTLSSLSKGFAELSTDGQFLKLRSKQVWSRRITGVGDGLVQGTEALAQGVAFGVSGVVRKPVQSARQSGLLGLAHGLGQAFLGFFVQPVSGALDFVSLTVDGFSASCSRCLEILNNKKNLQRIRNPRAFHVDNILREYSEREAVGQMVLYLAEASRSFGCTEIFKEPSKFAWSDCYSDHFVVPYQRIVLVTNRRVMLLQCAAPDRMEKKPCKIMWDVPWENILALELAKAGYPSASHLIVHLKSFSRSENFVRVIKCNTEETSEGEPQAVQICSIVRKMLKANQNDIMRLMVLVPSVQKHESSTQNEINSKDPQKRKRGIITSTELSFGSVSSEWRFVKHCINFTKVWGSEQESKGRCTLCQKQSSDSGEICSVWRPVCPEGYIAIGDIARRGSHPPNVAAVYCFSDQFFTLPVGYDLVWRNCLDDYKSPVSIWLPRAPEGYISLGCVAVPNFIEPELDLVYCISEHLVEETAFEEQKVWSAPESYPWACHIYQSCSDALPFVALRQPREESDWKPRRVVDNPLPSRLEASDAQ